jgi:hypothetical protein
MPRRDEACRPEMLGAKHGVPVVFLYEATIGSVFVLARGTYQAKACVGGLSLKP